MAKTMDPLEKKVLETIQAYHLVKSGEHVLVAVSGGADSVALLLVLRKLGERLPLQLFAAHVNHKLRGADSDEDEQFVRRLCAGLEVPLDVTQVDTRAEAEKTRQNLEDMARRIRYDFFFKVAGKHDAVVATGHTLSDQVETFLMKLIRGAGPAGLSGIYPVRINEQTTPPVTVVRPLIETTREEVLSYLVSRNQEYRTDVSNVDLSFDRNWVRHQLIPLVKERLNPDLVYAVGRTAGLFREVEEFLVSEGKKALESCGRMSDRGMVLNIPKLHDLPAILQKEVIRQSILRSRGELTNISLQNVESALALCEGPSGREVHLPGDLRVLREFDHLTFLSKRGAPGFCYRLTIPGEVYVGEVGKRVKVRRVAAQRVEVDRQRQTADTKSVLLKLEGDDLVVRNRRPGDRYARSARYPKTKLKKLLLEQRIPRSKRDRLLVLEFGGEIVWVEGFPPSPAYRVTATDETAVEVEIIKEEGL